MEENWEGDREEYHNNEKQNKEHQFTGAKKAPTEKKMLFFGSKWGEIKGSIIHLTA